MKSFTIGLAALCALSGGALAQENARVTAKAILIAASGDNENVYIVGADKTGISYITNARSVKIEKKRFSEVDSIYLFEPADYSEAMSLFEDRKYSEAATKFAEVAAHYAEFQSLKDNFSTLASYYQLECLRKQFKIEEYVKAAASFNAENLTRPDMLKQLEVNKFWEALQAKDWNRVDKLASEWQTKRVTVSQRAQIAFCHASALEQLGKKTEALEMYGQAMTADFTKSEVIVRNAVQASLLIYKSFPEVADAIVLWNTQDQNVNSKGYRLLIEANALARLYNKMGLGAGVALPEDCAVFLKYTPEGAEK